ncbi:MAG TPA: hypothetical protein VN088_03595 [Nocardioides sp.]|nr:hypothetical protein [Nocardioides sp.]
MRHWGDGAALLVVAGCLIGLGRWGRQRAEVLVAAHADVLERTRKIGSVRRGGLACYAAAATLAVAAVLAVL